MADGALPVDVDLDPAAPLLAVAFEVARELEPPSAPVDVTEERIGGVVRTIAEAIALHRERDRPAWREARRAELAAERVRGQKTARPRMPPAPPADDASEAEWAEWERAVAGAARTTSTVGAREKRPQRPRKPRTRKTEANPIPAGMSPIIPARKKSEKDAERARKRRKRWRVKPEEHAAMRALQGALLPYMREREAEFPRPTSMLEWTAEHWDSWLLEDHGSYEAVTVEAKAKLAAGEPTPQGGWDAWIDQEAQRRWAAVTAAAGRQQVLERERVVAAEIAAKATVKRASVNDAAAGGVRPRPNAKGQRSTVVADAGRKLDALVAAGDGWRSMVQRDLAARLGVGVSTLKALLSERGLSSTAAHRAREQPEQPPATAACSSDAPACVTAEPATDAESASASPTRSDPLEVAPIDAEIAAIDAAWLDAPAGSSTEADVEATSLEVTHTPAVAEENGEMDEPQPTPPSGEPAATGRRERVDALLRSSDVASWREIAKRVGVVPSFVSKRAAILGIVSNRDRRGEKCRAVDAVLLSAEAASLTAAQIGARCDAARVIVYQRVSALRKAGHSVAIQAEATAPPSRGDTARTIDAFLRSPSAAGLTLREIARRCVADPGFVWRRARALGITRAADVADTGTHMPPQKSTTTPAATPTPEQSSAPAPDSAPPAADAAEAQPSTPPKRRGRVAGSSKSPAHATSPEPAPPPPAPLATSGGLGPQDLASASLSAMLTTIQQVQHFAPTIRAFGRWLAEMPEEPPPAPPPVVVVMPKRYTCKPPVGRAPLPQK